MKWFSHDMFASLSRQMVNCWLAYTLAQPVDIDVPVALYFVRLYLGLPFVESAYYKMKSQLVTTINVRQSGKTVEELVSQKGY